MQKSIIVGEKSEGKSKPIPAITLDIRLEIKQPNDSTFDIHLNKINESFNVLAISGTWVRSSGQIIDDIRDVNDNCLQPGQFQKLLKYWDRWHLNDMRPGCVHQMGIDVLKRVNVIGIGVNIYKIKDKGIQSLFKLLYCQDVNEIKSKLAELEPIHHYSKGNSKLIDLILKIKENQCNGIIYKPTNDFETEWLEIIRFDEGEKAINWTRPFEHPEGMLGRKCDQCGYAYGTKWLLEQLPNEVIDFFESL